MVKIKADDDRLPKISRQHHETLVRDAHAERLKMLKPSFLRRSLEDDTERCLSLSLSLCSCGHRKTREMRVRPAMERTRAHFTVNPSPHSSSSSSSSFYLSSSFFSTSSSSYT